jgi:hypothetical protein
MAEALVVTVSITVGPFLMRNKTKGVSLSKYLIMSEMSSFLAYTMFFRIAKT